MLKQMHQNKCIREDTQIMRQYLKKKKKEFAFTLGFVAF